MKVGTNVLINSRDDFPKSLNHEVFSNIGQEASDAAVTDQKIVLVSSAAIAAGMIATHAQSRPSKSDGMVELQRLASIGWREIHNAWDNSIKGTATGALLLTRQELAPTDAVHRQEREQALEVINVLLEHGEVPLVNENDVIAHDEISFGDNDILAGLLAASMAKSDRYNRIRLFLISNTNGVYEEAGNPNNRLPVIEDTAAFRHLIYENASANGTGGMISKFAAVDIAHSEGVDVWIYDGRGGFKREAAANGQIGTYFPANPERS